jgi:hypothetical protein
MCVISSEATASAGTRSLPIHNAQMQASSSRAGAPGTPPPTSTEGGLPSKSPLLHPSPKRPLDSRPSPPPLPSVRACQSSATQWRRMAHGRQIDARFGPLENNNVFQGFHASLPCFCQVDHHVLPMCRPLTINEPCCALPVPRGRIIGLRMSLCEGWCIYLHNKRET